MELRIRELDVDIIPPNLSTMHRPEQGGSKIVIIGKPGTGKCFGKDTPVLMHDFSIRPVQDVRVGDKVFGDDGLPRTVLSLGRGRDVLYKVCQAPFGIDYIVNSEHILCLQSWDATKTMEIRCKEVFETPLLLQDYGGYAWKGIFRRKVPDGCTSMECCRRLQRPYFLTHKDGEVEPFEFFSTTIPIVYPVRVEQVSEKEDDFYGFELDGNGRFCLGDGTITHNTTLITSLLYEKRHIFPVALIMSGTEDSNGHYKKLVPSSFVYNKLNEKKIEDFVIRQKAAKKHIANPWAVLLLDDCTDDPKLFNKSLFQGLYKNGRHWKMWFILSLQYCMDIKPVIRTNVDGVFILRESNLRNRKSLWENYAGIVPDFSMFCSIMDQITDNYTALYIHNATTSNSLEDCLFWYKAKDVPKEFRFGARDLWKFHYNRYDSRYSDPFV
jgi:Hom_end-associated Hint